jgi:hypothetical protein
LANDGLYYLIKKYKGIDLQEKGGLRFSLKYPECMIIFSEWSFGIGLLLFII